MPNETQKAVWKYWLYFWNVWVPHVTYGQPYGIIINGDTIDGKHHNSSHQISHNLGDQVELARSILAPRVAKAERLFVVRGTEAHVGISGEQEERLARELGAIPNDAGQYARYELWLRVGRGLVNVLHHIGCTGSQAYEATAVHKELVEALLECGRWEEKQPNIIVRSHRHRYIKTSISTDFGEAIAVVTPGWQGKTPFVWKIAGGRLSPPQFGGLVIAQGDHDLYTRSYVKSPKRGEAE